MKTERLKADGFFEQCNNLPRYTWPGFKNYKFYHGFIESLPVYLENTKESDVFRTVAIFKYKLKKP